MAKPAHQHPASASAGAPSTSVLPPAHTLLRPDAMSAEAQRATSPQPSQHAPPSGGLLPRPATALLLPAHSSILNRGVRHLGCHPLLHTCSPDRSPSRLESPMICTAPRGSTSLHRRPRSSHHNLYHANPRPAGHGASARTPRDTAIPHRQSGSPTVTRAGGRVDGVPSEGWSATREARARLAPLRGRRAPAAPLQLRRGVPGACG